MKEKERLIVFDLKDFGTVVVGASSLSYEEIQRLIESITSQEDVQSPDDVLNELEKTGKIKLLDYDYFEVYLDNEYNLDEMEND
ncbi:MAG: hypothetical protein QXE51_00165 [Nitrososphaeria archaeon]